MTDASLPTARLRAYYFTAVVSLVFAVVGFSYNAWRLEVSEDNNNIRTAAFEVLKELAALERVIYAAHYDQDPVAGNPRQGWVTVGLIADLSGLISEDVAARAALLHGQWSDGWQAVPKDAAVTNQLVDAIDAVRQDIKIVLADLQ